MHYCQYLKHGCIERDMQGPEAGVISYFVTKLRNICDWLCKNTPCLLIFYIFTKTAVSSTDF